MREAKSMYRGDIISAEDCDYNSARLLGIVCPFCSEALFLHSGGVRIKKGKTEIINPYFAHYHIASSSSDCERRILTKEGREQIKYLKSEARNQRLKLYNMHLWEMVAEDLNINRQSLKVIDNWFGRRKLEDFSIKVYKEWGASIDSVQKSVSATLQSFSEVPVDSLLVPQAALNWEISKEKQYFSFEVDKKLHNTICCEVCEFLATPTGKYAFTKIVKAALKLTALADKENLKQALALQPQSMLTGIVSLIIGTHWIDQIKKRLT